MSFPNDRFIFEPAALADGPELLGIMENSPFKGGVSVLFTRRPDPMRSFLQEGSGVEVLVCRDQQSGCIVGFGAYVIRELFLNGLPQKVGYIFSLRSRGDYLKTFPILHKAYGYLRERIGLASPTLSLTTILFENEHARRLLERSRRLMPDYRSLGQYETYVVKRLNTRFASNDGDLFKATREDLQDLAFFLREQGSQFQFYPSFTAADISGALPGGLGLDDFFILRDANGNILAAGALWDQKTYRQYLIQGYQGIYTLARSVSAIIRHPRLPLFPRPGSQMDFKTLSYWAVKDNNPTIMELFIEKLRRREETAPFFLVGVHEKSPFQRVLRKKTMIVYRSLLYWVDWDRGLMSQPVFDTNRPIYLECGTL